MHGKPLPLIEQKEGTLVLNQATIYEIFENSDIANIDVAILPITGVERAGKSFTLNYFLRYLDTDDFGEVNEELKGFQWKGGTTAQTKGVYIWSKPFFKTINDKKVAIIVMDTQGAFGDNTKDDGIIIPFSLSVSTLQMYNVRGDLNSNVLQPLEIFLRQTANNEKILRKLVFFVRDWTLNNKYGLEGGHDYLSQKLSGKDKNTYQFINKNFDPILCFLWPSPGYNVSEDNFRGSLSELNERFVKHLKDAIPLVIDKLLLGPHLEGMALGQHIRDCFQSIQQKEPLLSIVEAYDITTSNKLSNIKNSIINKNKKIFNDFIKQLDCNSNRRDSENLLEIKKKRENLKIEALKEFEKHSDRKGDIYESKLHELEDELGSVLDEREESFLKNPCIQSIRRLRKHYGEELECFINGNIFTRDSKIIQKSKELQKTVEDKLANIPKLDSQLTDPIIDFDDNLNKILQNLKRRRKSAAKEAIITTGSLMVTGSVIRGSGLRVAVVTAISGGRIGYEAIKAAGKVKESDFQVVLKDMKLLISRYLEVGGDVKILVERAKIDD